MSSPAREYLKHQFCNSFRRRKLRAILDHLFGAFQLLNMSEVEECGFCRRVNREFLEKIGACAQWDDIVGLIREYRHPDDKDTVRSDARQLTFPCDAHPPFLPP
ncbi:MAG: hypothetical protein Greene041679_86 [Parcubacteria group bacterium Greene0416_79]|nr:MAG: hypothetical protein Greene041679_86 [Parcubacteria group bacterium Greene0416_79]